MTKQQHLLVFRFSSLGDVAMTVPVLRLLLKQHPSLRVTMVSAAFVRPLFDNMERLDFYAADLKGEHKGLGGLFKLYRACKKLGPFDGIADLHDVLRTKVLTGFFFSAGNKIAVIDKVRAEKKELTRKKNKKLQQLPSNFQRYAAVFATLGFPVDLIMEEGITREHAPIELEELKSNGNNLVGIAPFALHPEKTYPPEKMLEVIRMLSKNDKVRILLFGGKKEAPMLDEWSSSIEGVTSLAGKMSFEKELEWIANLDLMVSMDSANMHLASMYGVPVVSVWGGTHPYLGFYGWGQDPSNTVQIDLECRPSSVFGKKHCYNDLACMNGISPIMIHEKIIEQLNKGK